jgi:hypothetical protein
MVVGLRPSGIAPYLVPAGTERKEGFLKSDQRQRGRGCTALPTRGLVESPRRVAYVRDTSIYLVKWFHAEIVAHRPLTHHGGK